MVFLKEDNVLRIEAPAVKKFSSCGAAAALITSNLTWFSSEHNP
jgi:hypothetical protein